MPRSWNIATFIVPAMGLVFIVLYLPTFYGVYYSLFDIRYLLPTSFVGLENYVKLLADPALGAIVLRSAVFTAATVAATMAIALLIALWIDTLTGWFAMLVQILVIMPWVISNIVGALLFRWVFLNDIGLLMYVLDQLGFANLQPLSSPAGAMFVLIAFACWRTMGFAVILLLAGLKSIPRDYYEAALVDGANAWQRLREITLPLLKTSILINLVILTLSNLNNIETPLIITGGGPAGATNILPLDLYVRAFSEYDFNSAIAMAIGMFLANTLLVLAYVRLVRWRM